MGLTSPVAKSFVAGCCSGTCSTLLFQPLDLVKTRLQIQVPLACATTGGRISMVSVANAVVRQDSVLALWRGLVPSLSRCVPGVGIYFSSIHVLKSKFQSSQQRAIESVLIGAVARTIAVVTLIPITVLKTRYESGLFDYKSIPRGLFHMYHTEGLRALCSGMAPTLVRDVPFSGIYLMFYTKLKKMVNERVFDQTLVHQLYVVCGLTAGSIAAVITQPADVVKTYMQMDSKNHKRIMSTIRYIYKTNGYQGFFKGIVPRTLRRTSTAALSWTVYETLSRKVGLT
ncbi:mitochondrial glycine transporter-like [Ostrea edulis]|uniref:mitochondrial glycine transporter-like n=1 Tax=Ostrea edulis TaxID=37623 RepID=UPI0020952D51|nr:mitochondrial glycine transporter-like [Ostrea edulis]